MTEILKSMAGNLCGLDKDQNLLVRGNKLILDYEGTAVEISAATAGGGNVAYFSPSDSISTLQAVHDSIVSAGGGQIIFTGNGHYAPTSLVTWDISKVSVNFGRAKFDLSGLSDGQFFITVISSDIGPDPNATFWWNQDMEGGWFYGNFVTGAGNASGPGAFRFNVTSLTSANNFQPRKIRISKLYKGITYANGSYFVRVYDTAINYCGRALFQEGSVTNFSENDTYTNCVFGNNDIHLQDLGGNVWGFDSCSFDYHKSRCFDLRHGAIVTLSGVSHIEFAYGVNTGETNTPILITDTGTSFFMYGGSIAYTGLGQNPNWISLISADNGTQHIVVKTDYMQGLGRQTDTLGFDSLVNCTANQIPIVEVECRSRFAGVIDVPSIGLAAETAGVGGMARNGFDDIYNEIAHYTYLGGTTAITRITADENGMTLKNTKNCLKITGQGKVNISLPNAPSHRRMAWELATNAAFMTGTATIKERRTTYGIKYDGNVTLALTADTRGVTYTISTINLANSANAWVRRTWKDVTSSVDMVPIQRMAPLTVIEIDTTSMSAGALYLSHFAFDVL